MLEELGLSGKESELTKINPNTANYEVKLGETDAGTILDTTSESTE